MPHLSKYITNQIRILISCITTGEGTLKIFKDCIPFCPVSSCILNVLQNHVLDFIAFQTSNFRVLRELSLPLLVFYIFFIFLNELLVTPFVFYQISSPRKKIPVTPAQNHYRIFIFVHICYR